MDSVSVAMATFNGENHIQRQLDSLAAQTRVPTELVVTDDGSEDDTVPIIEAFAKTASFPVKVYRNETRLGYRANFMRAAGRCRSELIAFCDQDDYWYRHKIAASLKPFTDPDIVLVYHNADIVTDEGKHIGPLISDATRKPILTPLSSGPFLPFALGFTLVFRRSLTRLSDLRSNSYDQDDPSQPLSHDKWIFFLANVFGVIAYLDEPLAAYIQHTDNTVGWRKASIRESFRSRVLQRSSVYAQYIKAAENRADILEIAKSKVDGVWAERAATATKYYRKVSWLFAERYALYTGATLSNRIKAFRTIQKSGGYAGTWGFGQKAFLTDIFLGALIGQFLQSRSTVHSGSG